MNEDEVMAAQAETAEILRKEIANERAHMTKCLEVALETFQIIADTPGKLMPSGEVGVEMAQAYACIEKHFGCKLSDDATMLLLGNLTVTLMQQGGMSLCVIWSWAHAIEHATNMSLGREPGTQVH